MMPAAGRLVFLFPGQGSQRPGMGRDLADAYPAARRIFEEADRILDIPLSKVCFEGPEEELRRTDVTQPALFVHSMATLAAMGVAPGPGSAVAGHSLGEWTAVVAAGALGFADGLRLVRRRGELMEAAGRARSGTMAAVMGLGADVLEEICREVEGTVVVANHNSPLQIVLSGESAAVEAAMEAARARGARRVVPLPVGGAFHSPLMEPAARGLNEALAGVTLHSARVPIVANATAQFVQEAQEIREALAQQLLSPVRWVDSMNRLMEWGGRRFVEVGTGRVLSGLLRQIYGQDLCQAVGDVASLAAWREALVRA